MGRKRKAWSWCRTGKMNQQIPLSFQGHLCYQQSHSWLGQASPEGWQCWWHWCLVVCQTQRHPQRAYVHLFVRWGMEWAQVQAARFEHTILLGRTHSWVGQVTNYFSQGDFSCCGSNIISCRENKQGRQKGKERAYSGTIILTRLWGGL